MWGGDAEVAKRPVITIGKVYGVSQGTSTAIQVRARDFPPLFPQGSRFEVVGRLSQAMRPLTILGFPIGQLRPVGALWALERHGQETRQSQASN
jgi:hypothetical protein